MERLRKLLFNQMVSEKTTNLFLNEIRDRPTEFLLKLVKERESLDSVLNQIGLSPGLDRVGVLTALDIWSKEVDQERKTMKKKTKIDQQEGNNEKNEESTTDIDQPEENDMVDAEESTTNRSREVTKEKEETPPEIDQPEGNNEKNEESTTDREVTKEKEETPPENIPVEKWTVGQVVQWAANYIKPEHVSILSVQEVDGKALLKVDTVTLERWGFPGGIALNLFGEIEKLKPTQQDIYLPPKDENITQILINLHFDLGVKYWLDHLSNLSGIKMCSPSVVLPFKDVSLFVRGDLPSEIGSNNRLDLRLLEGHLGKPNVHSPAVIYCLEHIKQSVNRNFCTPVLFLSGSGVGKTKAIFDLLKLYYGVFLDCTPGSGGKDLNAMFRNISTIVTSQIQNFEEKCKYEIMLVVAARAVALFLSVVQGKINKPEQWLLTQLNGLASIHYESGLKVINDYLRTNCDIKSLIEFFAVFRKYFNTRFLLMVDEANLLLDMHTNVFSRPSDATTHSARPLFSLLISELTSLSDCFLVSAGTRLELKDKELWMSCVAKIGVESGTQAIVFSDFPLLKEYDKGSLSLFRRLIHPKYIQIVKDVFFRHVQGPARIRFLTSYVSFLANSHKNFASPYFIINIENPVINLETQFKNATQRYFYALLYDKYDWTLYTMIYKFELRIGKDEAYGYLCKLVICYLINDGVITLEENKAQWMAEGFCRLTQQNAAYLIDEPFIVKAVILYLQDKKVLLSEYFVKNLTSSFDATSAGVLMDTLICLCFMDLRDKYFSEIPCFDGLPYPEGEKIELSSALKLKKGDSEALLNAVKKSYGDIYILPKHYAGPDGLYLSPNVLIINANKTQQKISLPTRDVNSNYHTTDLRNLFRGFDNVKNENILIEKKKIWEYLSYSSDKKPKIIIRLHFILPCAAKSKDSQFIGWTKNSTREVETSITYECPHLSQVDDEMYKTSITLNIPQYAIDIDRNNMRECGLFSSVVCDALEKLFCL